MPRSDGKRSGEPKKATFPKNPPYIPKRLRRRLYDWEHDPQVGAMADMMIKPGSQNPRKRGPKRDGGV